MMIYLCIAFFAAQAAWAMKDILLPYELTNVEISYNSNGEEFCIPTAIINKQSVRAVQVASSAETVNKNDTTIWHIKKTPIHINSTQKGITINGIYYDLNCFDLDLSALLLYIECKRLKNPNIKTFIIPKSLYKKLYNQRLFDTSSILGAFNHRNIFLQPPAYLLRGQPKVPKPIAIDLSYNSILRHLLPLKGLVDLYGKGFIQDLKTKFDAIDQGACNRPERTVFFRHSKKEVPESVFDYYIGKEYYLIDPRYLNDIIESFQNDSTLLSNNQIESLTARVRRLLLLIQIYFIKEEKKTINNVFARLIIFWLVESNTSSSREWWELAQKFGIVHPEM